MRDNCRICGRPEVPPATWRAWPCGNCAAIAERHDEYFHVPKLFTFAGLKNQACGIRYLLRALRLAALGRTPSAREHGRVGGAAAAVRFWAWGWYVLERRGWVATHAVGLYGRPDRKGGRNQNAVAEEDAKPVSYEAS